MAAGLRGGWPILLRPYCCSAAVTQCALTSQSRSRAIYKSRSGWEMTEKMLTSATAGGRGAGW